MGNGGYFEAGRRPPTSLATSSIDKDGCASEDDWFAATVDHTYPDAPRRIWDAFHGRWVGVLSSFDGTVTTNYLNLIVSETADPLGAWESFAIPFNNDLPDFPGIASSTDRIVIAVDDFVYPAATFLGPDVLVIPWSAILAGTSLTAAVLLGDASIAHMRPAQVLSPSADVHLIYELVSTGDVYYARISGSATVCAALSKTRRSPLLPFSGCSRIPTGAGGDPLPRRRGRRPFLANRCAAVRSGPPRGNLRPAGF